MKSSRSDVAIIGMAGIYPGAPDVDEFWSNILSKFDAVTDPPANWKVEEFYDPQSTDNDRIYCKKGGFIGDFTQFNPLEFGIMPGSVDGSDPEIFLALKVARDVLKDAGYLDRRFDRKRTAVVLGHGNYMNRGLGTAFNHILVINQVLDILKTLRPETTEEDLRTIKKDLKAGLPPFKADTCAGLISNLLSGMIANRLDLQGPNFVIDAACASSLIALDLGVNKLLSRECDMAIVGGVQAYTSLPVFVVFSLLGALSRRGKIRPFDKDADGTILGEGAGMMVIKRLEDAERDDDRIYAVVKGIGTSSDGKAQAVLVPRLEGEILALERAYQTSRIPTETIGLMEAHGTATKVGDVTEIQALTRLFGNRSGDFPNCALGSVKSMISHTIPASGMASLIKSTLSLYHKILPPTLCGEPNPDLELDKTPFYLNTKTRPWIHGGSQPRRAGVSAFGFGGINAHAILEEYNGVSDTKQTPFNYKWDTEVIILQSESREDLIESGRKLLQFISDDPRADIMDIAYTFNCRLSESKTCRLSIVADSLSNFEKKLNFALNKLADSACNEIKDRSGIFYFDKPLGREGKLAFIFPGEGAQYVNMLSNLCVHFPEVRQWFDRAERVFQKRSLHPSLSQVLFPPPHASPELSLSVDKALWSMEYAVMSIWAANLGINNLLRCLEIQPDAMIGHSIGQDVALWASGVIVEEEERILENYYDNSIMQKALEENIPKARLMTVGGMHPSAVAAIAEESNGELYVSMDNCPNQVVLCGPENAVRSTRDRLIKEGAICAFLPFDRAYHTPLYKPLCDVISERVKDIELRHPEVDVYSCTTAKLFPGVPDEIRKIMVEQWAFPVRFRETIEAMYEDGIRIFVEVGPRGNLTAFVDDILRKRQYAAVPADIPSLSSVTQLNYMLGLLAAHGVKMKPDYIYNMRNPKRLFIKGVTEGDVTGEKTAGNKDQGKTGLMKLEMALPGLTLSDKMKGALSINNVPRPDNNGKINEGETHAIISPFRFGKTHEISRMQNTFSGIQDKMLRSKVMQEHLKSMALFLDAQQEIMEAFAENKNIVDPQPDETEESLIRTPWTSPVAGITDKGVFHACLCMGTDNGFKPEELATIILSRSEQEMWQRLSGSNQHRTRWLLGRLAAKDAVYLFLKDKYQIEAHPSDIEIFNDPYGKPFVSGELIKKINCALAISIAHSENISVSVAGEYITGFRGIGLDIERLDRNNDGLEEGGFSSSERDLLDKFASSERKEWLLRFWCAKEAVAKALGRGMMGNPLNLLIANADMQTGRIELKINRQFSEELSDLTGKTVAVHTGRDDVLLFASALL